MEQTQKHNKTRRGIQRQPGPEQQPGPASSILVSHIRVGEQAAAPRLQGIVANAF
eukprot:m.135816 g.135816  ORF g.135816 m.135816 type:complete len:55 (+) comp9536_c0_seq1:3672-3836(+)